MKEELNLILKTQQNLDREFVKQIELMVFMLEKIIKRIENLEKFLSK